ncbi:SRPBCC family protein [Acinetobacter sp. S40]|uniref:SRPBCC family protein n=1 Tax=Acinetobacter sp. S40 TaxID=2767434 RepID=UPI001909646E|nr:SRPBCC family protein [Acinetobacter sp. S40]MBJ9986180.1 SRPBCC family protein [Acinetobacter sp. S40]
MRQFAYGCGIFVSFLTYSSSSSAQFFTWNENIPSSLAVFQQDPQQLANFAQNNIVIYAHPYTKTNVPTQKKNPQPNVQFVSAAIVVPVSTQEVAKVLTDYSHYVGLFPTLKSAKIEEKSGSITRVKYKVQIPTPIPVLNFNEDISMQHQVGTNSVASLITDAPVPYGIGKFEWFNLGPQKTLITLTQWGDLNQINGFLLRKILSAVPDAKLGIPIGSNAFILESLKRKWMKTQATVLEAGQVPPLQLNSNQIRKINDLSRSTGYPVSFIQPSSTVPYPHGRETMRFTTTYQYYAKTPQQLQNWLNPASFQTLFPRQIKKVELTSATPQQQDANFRVSVGLGVINIPFNFKMRFNIDSTQSQYSAIGGDLRFVKGEMQLLPQSNGTLFKMTSAAKIDEKAPFLLRAMRSLPYHDMLPAAGGNAVFSLKIKEKMK